MDEDPWAAEGDPHRHKPVEDPEVGLDDEGIAANEYAVLVRTLLRYPEVTGPELASALRETEDEALSPEIDVPRTLTVLLWYYSGHDFMPGVYDHLGRLWRELYTKVEGRPPRAR